MARSHRKAASNIGHESCRPPRANPGPALVIRRELPLGKKLAFAVPTVLGILFGLELHCGRAA